MIGLMEIKDIIIQFTQATKALTGYEIQVVDEEDRLVAETKSLDSTAAGESKVHRSIYSAIKHGDRVLERLGVSPLMKSRQSCFQAVRRRLLIYSTR